MKSLGLGSYAYSLITCEIQKCSLVSQFLQDMIIKRMVPDNAQDPLLTTTSVCCSSDCQGSMVITSTVKAYSTIGVDRDVATTLQGVRAAEKEQLELQLHCVPFNLYSLLGIGL